MNKISGIKENISQEIIVIRELIYYDNLKKKTYLNKYETLNNVY